MPAADARPVPRKNVAWRLYLAIRKNDGTLVTGWTGADTEVALDGGTYVDATNELTEIGTSGTGFIDFTAAEMNADAVLIKATVTNSGALPLTLTVYPEEIGDYRSNVEQWGGTAVAIAIVNASLEKILGTAVTEGTAGRLAARLSSFLDVATANLTLNSANQTGDAYGVVNNGTHGNAAIKSLIDTVDDFIDTEVAAIKAKTDNLPASPANESTVAAIKSKTDNLPLSPANETTVAALAAKFSGITLVKNWLGALAGKTADTTTRAEINATTAGANYNETTDSQEAIRDRGDAAWVTGGGGGGGGGTVTGFDQAALNQLTAIAVHVQALVDQAVGSIRLVRSDDYHETDGRHLQWDQVAAEQGRWGDLTGATVVFNMRRSGQTSLTAACSVATVGSLYRIKCNLTSTQTTLLVGEWEWDVQATLSGSNRKLTLRLGRAYVSQDAG